MNKLQYYLWNWIEFVPFLPYSAEMFTVDIWGKSQRMYCKVSSSNTSRLEAHAGFFQIAYEGDFQYLCTVTFWQKVDFLIKVYSM